ncbi:porin [Bradyrhizobium ottawaense]|uniref:porin n=1 Tax=Bradyrhizobium ottawaense TaxID=931866 RepID=UPI000BE7F74A|nr:porin [Bradyrhizobium ottawaense]PDT64021.1 porin [Bradyrhizobium ottawaense]
MKLMKNLVLGSAAMLAASGVRAADLPVKAKPVEYVKICSLYGAGFYYIPGSDTCIRLGGYLRAEVAANTNSVYTGNTSGAGGAGNRFTNALTWRARQALDIDTRTATEYGVVRTFAELAFSWTDGTYAGLGNGGATYSGDFAGGGSLGVYYGFIQFAGFTMGHAVSQFSMPWTAYPGNNFDGLVGGGGTVVGVNQFSYTADFGNGVSASISAQDPVQNYQAGVQNVSIGAGGIPTTGLGPFGTSNYAGAVAPDFVGMIRVDQAWGLFQASVAAHDNNVAYYGANELTGHPNNVWGFAGQVGLSLKNIPTGAGDSINISAVYTDGATRYNIQEFSQAAAMTIFSGTNLPGAYQSIGFGMAPDTVFGNNGGAQQLIRTWGMRGAFNHNWSPYWSSSLYGAYAAITYSSGAKALICGNGVTGGSFQATYGAGVTSCNPDYGVAQLGVITRWTPVKNLTFSADLTYTHLAQNMSGTIAYPGSAAIGKPPATYELKDQNTLTALFRAQRNF